MDKLNVPDTTHMLKFEWLMKKYKNGTREEKDQVIDYVIEYADVAKGFPHSFPFGIAMITADKLPHTKP